MLAAVPLLFLLLGETQPDPDLHRKALELYRARQYNDAAVLFAKASESEEKGGPAHRESVLLAGQSYYLAAKFRDALPWLEREMEQGASAVELKYMLGITYIQNYQVDKARNSFASRFGVAPDSAAAYLFVAQFLVRQDFEALAVEQLEKSRSIDPKLPQVHFLLGELATFHGQTERAIEELKREITINPNFAMAYYKLGDAYTRREEWELVLVFNFLWRPLFPRLVEALRPGGILLCESFTREHALAYGRPANPDHVLEPGELPRLVAPLVT